MNKTWGFIIVLVSILRAQAQPAVTTEKPVAKFTKGFANAVKQMPYNRLVQSAGKVITYGNPELENHALDVTILADKKNVVAEDRYGIAIIDAKTNVIATQWSFSDSAAYKDLMSTYSGIASFVYNNETYVVWGAQGAGANRGFVVIAEVNKNKMGKVSFIQCKAIAPAKVAIPNSVAINMENNTPFLYVVLNGNNKLIKINAVNHETEWAANTGEAPFGICIVNNKAYITNWAGETVTDTTQEHAGTPWGSVYTNPVTGATKEGSVSVIDISNGQKINKLMVGLHPNVIIKSKDERFVYVANGNSDNISVIDVKKEQVIDSISVGLFLRQNRYYGSSPDGLCINADGTKLFVANGLDNAIAVIKLGSIISVNGNGKTKVQGYIPTEAYPSGIAYFNNRLYVANLEAKGADVLSEVHELKRANDNPLKPFSIHKELTSVSVILSNNSSVKCIHTKSKEA
ncbi:MAG: hypothetical protein M3R72_08160 [Bacteroidota bacterium]|nr:hypothetical protein [Bacteroidota bacterium]